ncbi:OmpP1/FadL family transporter [Faecalibacter bovis]|uniref:Outer membrane protein transport protein n=1 Tax=Faecalibacter bovis TaxID=2898187 RepID=A0ABX7XF46_9FLAO|nr:outer membrane protein transport protein [Faecalibacter bovis]MBS7332639.1 outer membrane protein transport protein [Weeksellaceae bacterium]QTV06553.1 outer membrane protein transport protein [Faecalibacter bovis]
MKKIFLTLALATLSSSAFAGGYRVALQGVRQAALGGNSTTIARDASVAFYNPAGLAFVDAKLSIAAGVFGVKSEAKWQDPQTLNHATTDNGLSTPIYLAVSYKPTDDLAIGLSVTTPFGSSLTWPNDWENRSNITEIELQAFNIQPTIAYKFTDWFSIGAGFIYTHGSATLNKIQTVAGNDIGLELEDKDAHGLGFNIGTMFRPTEKWNVALAYRSNSEANANYGAVRWSNVPTGLSTNPTFQTTEWKTSLPLPSEFVVGTSYKLSPKFELFGEVSWQNWTKYKDLTIVLQNPETGYEQESVSVKNWKDNTIYRIGAEYTFNEMIQGRIGYYHDKSPVPSQFWSSETPSTDNNAFTAGLGFNFKNGFMLDLYGGYVKGKERYIYNVDQDFRGDVKLTAFNFGLGLAYNIK